MRFASIFGALSKAPCDRRLVSLRSRHGGARDRADQRWDSAAASGAKSASISSDIFDERLRLWSSETMRSLGDLVLHPPDAPRGPDERRVEADEGRRRRPPRKRSRWIRRRPTLLPPLRTDGGAPYRVRQPVRGGASRGRSRGDRVSRRATRARAFCGRRSTGRPLAANGSRP